MWYPPPLSPSDLPPGSYDSNVSVLVGTIVFTLLVSTAAVSARVYTRWRIVNKVGVDDWMAIVSLLLIYSVAIAMACMTMFGLGHHVWVVPAEDMMLYMRSFFVSVILYIFALFAIKMTFLCQYYRGLAIPRLRPLFIGATILVFVWSTFQILFGLFACTPINSIWDPSVKPTYCVGAQTGQFIHAAGNIATDILILLLPLFILWRVRLVRAQKLALMAIFSLGFLTVTLSVLRTAILRIDDDPTWQNVPGACWTLGEMASGITCACLPTLRPLVSGYFPQLDADANNQDGDGSGPQRKIEESSDASTNREFGWSRDGSYSAEPSPPARSEDAESGILFRV